MSTPYKSINNLKVSENLLSFVDNELLKDTDITPEIFTGIENYFYCKWLVKFHF